MPGGEAHQAPVLLQEGGVRGVPQAVPQLPGTARRALLERGGAGDTRTPVTGAVAAPSRPAVRSRA